MGTTVWNTTLALRQETYDKRELNGAGAEAMGGNLQADRAQGCALHRAGAQHDPADQEAQPYRHRGDALPVPGRAVMPDQHKLTREEHKVAVVKFTQELTDHPAGQCWQRLRVKLILIERRVFGESGLRRDVMSDDESASLDGKLTPSP